MIGTIAGMPWAAVARIRVALYRNGWKSPVSLGRRTVSVGALEMGGTGKTPVTIAVARRLAASGARPAILSRGYGRNTDTPLLVSHGDGRGPIVAADSAGDEPWLMAHLLREVPVAVAARREQAAAMIDSSVDAYVLDDGFQHVRVARDADLVVVDAGSPFWTQSPPPLGRLRESWQAAGRATAFVVHGEADELARRWPDTPQLNAHLAAPRFVPLDDWLRDPAAAGGDSETPRRAAAFAGIARPDRFFATLESTAIEICHRRAYPDHHRFTADDVRGFADAAVSRGAETLFTTEKDAARLAALDLGDLDLRVVTYGVDVGPTDELLALCGAAP